MPHWMTAAGFIAGGLLLWIAPSPWFRRQESSLDARLGLPAGTVERLIGAAIAACESQASRNAPPASRRVAHSGKAAATGPDGR